MAITTYYRGVAFIKDFFVKYLNSIFIAANKGALVLTDGTTKIDFSNVPYVIKRASWDYRNLPAVLVGAMSGNYKYLSIAKDFIYEGDYADDDDALQYKFYGGDIHLSLAIEVWATTIEERDRLVDITCLYLAHPDAKDYFAKHSIALETPPAIRGERDEMRPNIDYPMYVTSLSMATVSEWRIKTPVDEPLEEVVTNIEAYVNF
jgi:hypothetical protein